MIKPLQSVFLAFFFFVCAFLPLFAQNSPQSEFLDADTLQVTFELPCSFDRLWNLITDYENSPNVMPNIKKASIIFSQHAKDVNVDHVTNVAGAGPFTVTYTVKMTSVKSKGLITWEQIKGPFSKNQGSWQITRLSEKLVKVVYIVSLNHKYMPDSIRQMLIKKSIPDLYGSLKKNTQD
ncbi:MAG: SRPBCC family protein [Leptospirales bacterium]|nr:SRPBCC family protein [Leptospirales bacterium]